MKVHYSVDSIDIRRSVITTGSFDGVHVGHMAIIKRLNKRAEQNRAESVLITFSPHPRKVLFPEAEGKDLQMINSKDEKIELLAETGLDHLVILEFTLAFSRTSSADFVKNILVDKLNAVHVIIGFNHHFGHNRKGDLDELITLGKKHAFTVEEIPEQDIQNETVSSTKIRKALHDGDIQRANAYLDHSYNISSEAGIEVHDGCKCMYLPIKPLGDDKLLPPSGIYAAYINYRNQNKREKAVFIITKNESGDKFEAYPIDGDLDKTNGHITIQLYKRIDTKSIDDLNCTILKGYIGEVEELIY